jgi:lipopolysaccharide/colanic/teichoic acid biosynthesis glycosyltransferase
MNNITAIVLRVIDVFLAFVGLVVLFPLFVTIYILGLFDTGVPILRQVRLGRNQKPFVLIKFRSMKTDTVHVASHLANKNAITPLGSVLRRTKLDELPQLWNVLIGQMSMVGPRPGLPNQVELTKARALHGVYSARPGITGLSQVNGVDMSTPDLLAATDACMLADLTTYKYARYIIITILGGGRGDCIKTGDSSDLAKNAVLKK